VDSAHSAPTKNSLFCCAPQFSARVFSPDSSSLIFQAPFFIPAGSLLLVHVGRPRPALPECCWRWDAFLCAYSGFSPPPGLDVFCRRCCCCLIHSRRCLSSVPVRGPFGFFPADPFLLFRRLADWLSSHPFSASISWYRLSCPRSRSSSRCCKFLTEELTSGCCSRINFLWAI
jgi:hypothetical protein